MPAPGHSDVWTADARHEAAGASVLSECGPAGCRGVWRVG
jgi:hypothetical protein